MADQPLTWLFKVIDNLSAPVDKMSASLEQIEGALGKAAGKLDGIEKSTSKAAEGGGLFALKLEAGIQIAEQGIEIFHRLAEGAIDLARDVLHASAASEKLDLQLGLLAGKETGAEVSDFLERVGKTSAFRPDDLKAMIQPLLRAGFKGEGLERAFAAAEDLAGGSAERLQRSIAQFEKIALKGGIDARELYSLGIPQKLFYDKLGTALGKGANEAKKLATEGKIRPDLMIAVLESAISEAEKGPLGTRALEAGKTLDAILTRLGNIPEQFFESFTKSSAFEPVKAFLSNLVKILSPDGEFGSRALGVIGDTFSAIFGGVTTENATEKVRGVVEGVVSFLEKIPPFVRQIRTMWEGWINAAGGGEGILNLLGSILSLTGSIIKIFLVVERVLAPVQGFVLFMVNGILDGVARILNFAMALDELSTGSIIQFVDNTIAAIDRVLLAFMKLPDQVWAAVLDLVQPFKDLPGQMWDAGVNAAQGFLDGLKSMGSALIELPMQLGGSVVDAFKQVLGIHSPSSVFRAFGENTVAGFVDGIEGKTDLAERAISGIGAGSGGFPSAPAGGAAGGENVFSFAFGDIVIGGTGSPEGDAHEAASRIKGILQSELQAFFQRLAVEQGVG